jgi:quinol monooxygenase YgiN
MSLKLVLPVLLLFVSLVGSRPAAAQGGAAGKNLYVVTYVDVFPNFAADTAKYLVQFAADSRKDPGSVRFEVMMDVSRTNHFSIVEVWKDRQAYDAHLNLPHTRTFREKLQPGLGSPYDERMYNALP